MNTIVSEFEQDRAQLEGWFQHMHANPELSMQEAKTAAYIEQELRKIGGFEIETGIGKYGIVASLKVGDSDRVIGLRADFDALPIHEVNDLPYRSQTEGVAHLCGHDAHSAMLLGAARHLARSRNFNGTVRLIFQPAEEIGQGASAMIDDGLFDRFPVDAVYGLHNMPGLPKGKLHFTSGELMAAVDTWEIEITGKGSHGSMPELSHDPVVTGAALVMALQTIVSRNVSPHNRAVITVGALLSGNAANVVAHSAILRLSIRTTRPEDRELVLRRVRQLTKAHCEGYECSYDIREGVPGAVLVNDEAETSSAAEIARDAFGQDQVISPGPTYLGSEDFAFMLQQEKGTFCLLGNGDTQMVHHPEYVFDQDLLPIGAAYWVALTEAKLR